uniref:Uncharacterized protein n=2 Tax=Oryza sativa subsp. japonica TaxID=39947 RepID=Q9AV26_ORYSJ|nr:hypothetical protein [Oryza sativa Japonica Group]AAP54892.1 hypothetical protein LOC_Os10g39940 [Oryza sativa Japonica Group]
MEANPISGLPSLPLVAAGSRIGGHPPGFCKINARGSTISLQNVAVGKAPHGQPLTGAGMHNAKKGQATTIAVTAITDKIEK